MMDPKAVTKAVGKVKPDVIFHMASQSFVSPLGTTRRFMDGNYKMTVHLFEGAPVARYQPADSHTRVRRGIRGDLRA